jgi:hypothetical protein
MEKLNMKIHSYDEVNHALLVSFSSDVSIKDVDSYQKLAFQPANYGELDLQAIMKIIAKTGVSVAEIQDKKDALDNDQIAVDSFKALAGTTTIWNVSDLTDPTPIQPNLTDIVNE